MQAFDLLFLISFQNPREKVSYWCVLMRLKINSLIEIALLHSLFALQKVSLLVIHVLIMSGLASKKKCI